MTDSSFRSSSRSGASTQTRLATNVDAMRSTLMSASIESSLAPVPARNVQRYSARTLELARTANAPIRMVGVGTTPGRPLLGYHEGIPWAVCPMELDPLFTQGNFPIPRAQRRQLERLDRAGIRMDQVFIAHEVPESLNNSIPPSLRSGGTHPVDRELLTSLVPHPGPAPSTRRFTQRAGKAARHVTKAATMTAAGVAMAGVGMVAAPAALISLAGVDPIIFGAQTLPASPGASILYELVRWEW